MWLFHLNHQALDCPGISCWHSEEHPSGLNGQLKSDVWYCSWTKSISINMNVFFYILYLTVIYPDRSIKNQFTFMMTTWLKWPQLTWRMCVFVCVHIPVPYNNPGGSLCIMCIKKCTINHYCSVGPAALCKSWYENPYKQSKYVG